MKKIDVIENDARLCTECLGIIGVEPTDRAACSCAGTQWGEEIRNLIASDVVKQTTYGQPDDAFTKIVDEIDRRPDTIEHRRHIYPKAAAKQVTIALAFDENPAASKTR
jgi:hypothetical protein